MTCDERIPKFQFVNPLHTQTSCHIIEPFNLQNPCMTLFLSNPCMHSDIYIYIVYPYQCRIFSTFLWLTSHQCGAPVRQLGRFSSLQTTMRYCGLWMFMCFFSTNKHKETGGPTLQKMEQNHTKHPTCTTIRWTLCVLTSILPFSTSAQVRRWPLKSCSGRGFQLCFWSHNLQHPNTRGTPKWMVYIGKSIENPLNIDLGVPPILGNLSMLAGCV